MRRRKLAAVSRRLVRSSSTSWSSSRIAAWDLVALITGCLPSYLCGTSVLPSPALACPRRDQCDLLPALLDSGLPVCSRRSAHHVPGPATPLTLLEVTGRPT